MTKRFLSVLLCAVMLLVLLPTAAFAMDYSVTGDKDLSDIFSGVLNGGDTLTIAAGATLTISNSELLSVERGAEVINNGTIINNGRFDNNGGTITNNGVITNNNRFNNTGTITNNNDTGVIDGNTGIVTNNFGTVSANAGTVTNNFGIVINTSTGTVINNFGGTVNGYAQNYYYQVTVTAGDHTTNTLTAAGGRFWIKSGATSSATFSPDLGYVINDAQSSDNIQAPITRNIDGTWTLTATATYNAATTVTLTVTAPITGLTLSTNAPTVGTPITATVAPSVATATYQWYENNSSSTANGTAINGATSASYTPLDNSVGRYLYCVATGTGISTGTAASAVTAGPVTLSVTSSVPHTGSDRQTELMVTLALISGAVLLSGIISRKKRA